jgi:hypothetical protein
MSTTPKFLKKQKNKELIPYYPELRSLIPTLGFNSSTKVFSYLKACNAFYIYDRIYCSEDKISKSIGDFHNSLTTNHIDKGFIFVMDVPNTDAVEVVHCLRLSKDNMIKYLKLKCYS